MTNDKKFVVQIGTGWLCYDDKGAMATGYPFSGELRKAAAFPTIEKAADAVASANRIADTYSAGVRQRGKVVPMPDPCGHYLDGHSGKKCGVAAGHDGNCGDPYYDDWVSVVSNTGDNK